MSVLEHDWFPRPLPERVQLGERSWLYSSYAFHHSHGAVRIGADCGVYNGTQFELGPDGAVEIGDFCTVVGAIIATNGRVAIGDHTFIAHEVVIAGSPFAMPPTDAACARSAPIEIGAGVWIGHRSVILGGVRIGEDAIIGAGTTVTADVPPGATAVGNPTRVLAR